MNKFELFCMIFYVLDAYWDESKDSSIGDYLSSANPFLFDDIGSADESVYLDFCRHVNEPISIENSYSKAIKYLQTIDNKKLVDAFKKTSEDEWTDSVKDYLAAPHK